MRSVSLIATALGAAAAAALAFPGVVVHEASRISQTTQKSIEKNSHNPAKSKSNKLQATLGGGLGSWGGKKRRAAYGWTNRHAQRVALKKRNQAKHRAGSRGRS